MKVFHVAAILLLVCVGMTGCPKPKKLKKAPPAAPGPAKTPAEDARARFDTVCATCHGTAGKGDGAASASFPVKPRDYTDAAWQDSVKDADLAKVIVEGGAAVGKSELMIATPDLKDKPEVVAELVKLIRSFRQK